MDANEGFVIEAWAARPPDEPKAMLDISARLAFVQRPEVARRNDALTQLLHRA